MTAREKIAFFQKKKNVTTTKMANDKDILKPLNAGELTEERGKYLFWGKSLTWRRKNLVGD